jgi:hypothetical protein
VAGSRKHRDPVARGIHQPIEIDPPAINCLCADCSICEAPSMKSRRNIRVLSMAALTAVLHVSVPSFAQSNSNSSGVVDDWTFHRLVFSSPGTQEETIKNGTFERWKAITNDPRYQMEMRRRSRSQAMRDKNIRETQPTLQAQALSQRSGGGKQTISKD